MADCLYARGSTATGLESRPTRLGAGCRSPRSLAEASGTPIRIASAVEDGIDPNDLALRAIIDCEREPLRQQAVIPLEDDGVNSREQEERVDVGEDRIEEVRTQARTLALVEEHARYEVLPGGFEDLDPHGLRRRISSLALSQGMDPSWPEAWRLSRASRTSR